MANLNDLIYDYQTAWRHGDTETIVQADSELRQAYDDSKMEYTYLSKPYAGVLASVQRLSVDESAFIEEEAHESFVVGSPFHPTATGLGVTKEAACKQLARYFDHMYKEFLPSFKIGKDKKIDMYRDMFDNATRLFPDRAPTLRKKRAPNKEKYDD